MIRIVVPTPKTEEEYKQTVQYNCLANLIKKYDLEGEDERLVLEIEEENTTGLSKLYNKFLARPKWNWLYGTDDIIVFMHDDLEVHDQFLVEKLKKAHETYDIVGLAGATSQRYTKDKPSVWHLCKDKNDDTRGIVSHFIPKGFNNSANAHYNSAYFGPTPSKVDVIDGLFISVKVKALEEKNVTFDDDFNFHHYDMALCLRAKQAGLKIGVWPIFCVHHGLGEFNTPEWKASHELFIQKYGNK